MRKSDRPSLNAGAYIGSQDPPTKRALHEAIALRPETVRFYTIGSGGTMRFDYLTIGELADIGHYMLAVTGPDPRRNPTWKALVYLDGKLVRFS